MVDLVTSIWQGPPYNVEIPDEQMGPLSSFLVARGIGLLGVAGNGVVTAAGAVPGLAGQAATRFANALPNPITVIQE